MSRERRLDAITNAFIPGMYIIISRAKNEQIDFRNSVDYDTNADFRRFDARGRGRNYNKGERDAADLLNHCREMRFSSGWNFFGYVKPRSSRVSERASALHVGAASRCRIGQADTIDFTRSRGLLSIFLFETSSTQSNYALFFSARLSTMDGEKRRFSYLKKIVSTSYSAKLYENIPERVASRSNCVSKTFF